MRCNVGGSNGTWSGTLTHTVAAGDEIGFTIDEYIGHPGPALVYMSQSTVSNVSDYDGSGDWFKIYEMGADANSAGLQWFAAGAYSVNFTIPADVPAGQYLVRGESIALHGAEEAGGAQYYMGCAQIEVTSSSTSTPANLVKIPGLYSETDPGIMIDIYYPIPTNYTMPGPNLWPDASTSVLGNASVQANTTDDATTSSSGSTGSTGSSASSSATTSTVAAATSAAAVVASTPAAAATTSVAAVATSAATTPSAVTSAVAVATPSSVTSAAAVATSAAADTGDDDECEPDEEAVDAAAVRRAFRFHREGY